MNIVQAIIEIFDNFLEEKGVDIQNPEREGDDNAAQIYGTDYANLESAIGQILKREPCMVDTGWHWFSGVISYFDSYGIVIKSEQVQEYIEEHSME